jgi:hypothetical protein
LVFRGSNAAASLKHIVRIVQYDPVPRLPRQQCRGLIEAGLPGLGNFLNGEVRAGSVLV